MRNETLWEAICYLAAIAEPVSIEDAIKRSAVTEAIAKVEITRFVEDQLVVPVAGGRLKLSDKGRESCGMQHRTAEVVEEANLGGAERIRTAE